jgi:hypothetical protein
MKTKIRVLLMTATLLSFGSPPKLQAVSPPPDGGYPGGNTAEGQAALFSVATGGYNTAAGFLSLRSDISGSFNTAVGAGTLLANTADGNTATGAGALFHNTTAGMNTANGGFALFNNTTGSENTATGDEALFFNTTGNHSTATGALALFSNTGSNNTADGYAALNANGCGIDNTATGSEALSNNTSGNFNTAIGRSALPNNTTGGANTALGDGAGTGLTGGNGNVYLGFGVGAAPGESNFTRIRNIGSTPIMGGATVVIASTGGNGDQILGFASSSRRYKRDITDMGRSSETLFALKPVTFRARQSNTPADVKHYGLIAEDVAMVDPDLVIYNPEGKPETLRFDSINAMLLNEFLKEHRRVQEQQATIAQLRREIEMIVAHSKQQDSEIQQVRDQVQTAKADMHVATANP